MEFFTTIKIKILNLHAQIKVLSGPILKITVLLNIVLAIPFSILFLTDYHTDSPSIESFFYNFIFFSLGLAFILLQFIKRSFWQTFISYFMFAMIVLSLFQQFDFRLDEAPYCKIISPDGQKTYYVQIIVPAAGIVDIGIQYNNWSFIEKTLAVGVYGGQGTNFCAAKWIDNDTIMVHDTKSEQEPISYRITVFNIYWDRLINIITYYAPIILLSELLRRIIQWLFPIVLKRL